MGKHITSTKLKGELTFDLDSQTITITTLTKDSEYTYDLVSILDEYNGKTISISIAEDKDLEPIE